MFVCCFWFFSRILYPRPVEKPRSVWQKLSERLLPNNYKKIILVFPANAGQRSQKWRQLGKPSITADRSASPWLPAGCPLGDKWFQSDDWSVTLATALTPALHQRKRCFQRTCQRAAGFFSGGKHSAAFLSASHHRHCGQTCCLLLQDLCPHFDISAYPLFPWVLGVLILNCLFAPHETHTQKKSSEGAICALGSDDTQTPCWVLLQTFFRIQ